ncbi:MAG: family 1 encapsulin nanocompartment shell protein, partial [Thermoleophilaceae bacterium]
MNHLLREQAPITAAAWGQIDEEARERLAPALAARKLVDFSGPHGWEHSSTSLGRVEAIGDAPADGLEARQRRVLPLVELRAPFSLAIEELLDADRGAEDVDFDALDDAAHRIAMAENRAVFHGWPAAAIDGIAESSTLEAIPLGDDCARYPRHVAKAVEMLLTAGIDGPYGLALGPDPYTRVLETGEHGGYPLLDHLRKIIDGPLVWAPGVEGALVLSLRGGDFL